jgi:hypothetical protein
MDIYFDSLVNDIRLQAGDLYFTSDVSFVEGIKQELIAYLQTFLGEWFLDDPLAPVVGVPYFQSLFFDKIPTLELADVIFRDAINQVPGISSVQNLDFQYDIATRNMVVIFTCTTGQDIAFSGSISIGV